MARGGGKPWSGFGAEAGAGLAWLGFFCYDMLPRGFKLGPLYSAFVYNIKHAGFQ